MRRGLRMASLVALGLLAYGASLVLTLPAGLAWQWFGARAPVTVYAPGGSVWYGRAAAVTQGPRRIDDVRWALQPAALLGLELGARIRGELPDGRVEALARAGLDGRLHLTDVRADMDIDTLLAWAGRQGLDRFAAGHFEALLPRLSLAEGRPVAAEGLLNWNGAAIGPEGRIGLGDLALRLSPAADGEGIRGTLQSRGGALAVEGTLDLRPDGRFKLVAAIAPRDPADPDARQVTELLGLANPGGETEVTLRGSLAGGGLQITQR